MRTMNGMNGLWLFNDRVVLSAQYCAKWQRGGFGLHDNGGRGPNEVFDCTLTIYKLTLGITLWGIGRWHRLLKFLPLRMDWDLIKPLGAPGSED